MKTVTKLSFKYLLIIIIGVSSLKILFLDVYAIEINVLNTDNPITSLSKHSLAAFVYKKNSLIFSGNAGKIIIININKDKYEELIKRIDSIKNNVRINMDSEYKECAKKYTKLPLEYCKDYIYNDDLHSVDVKIINYTYYAFFLFFLTFFLLLKNTKLFNKFIILISVLTFYVLSFYTNIYLNKNETKVKKYRYIYSVPYFIFDSNNTSNNYLKIFAKTIGCESEEFYLSRFMNGNAIEIISKNPNLDQCLFKKYESNTISDDKKFNYIIDPILLIQKQEL